MSQSNRHAANSGRISCLSPCTLPVLIIRGSLLPAAWSCCIYSTPRQSHAATESKQGLIQCFHSKAQLRKTGPALTSLEKHNGFSGRFILVSLKFKSNSWSNTAIRTCSLTTNKNSDILKPLRGTSTGSEAIFKSKSDADAWHLTYTTNETISEDNGDHCPVFYNALAQNALRHTNWKRRFVAYERDRSAVLIFTLYGWKKDEIFL